VTGIVRVPTTIQP